MTENLDRVERKILELEYSIVCPNISMNIAVRNVRRGDGGWIADITFEGEFTILNVEYPDKYFSIVTIDLDDKCVTDTLPN